MCGPRHPEKKVAGAPPEHVPSGDPNAPEHRNMKRLFAAALLAAIPFLASATTYSTDVTDLWSISSESGWGVNFIQQDDTLFATLFVYGTDGKPAWYVAPQMAPPASGSLTFTGDLYATTGPWFGGAFDPASVGVRKVGTATFTLDSVTEGTFTYGVDGVSVTKHVVRQLWRYDLISGTYVGALSGTASGCGQGLDGYSETPITVVIAQDAANNVALSESAAGGSTCNYTGTYSQAGRMGRILGSGGCGDIDAGEVQTTIAGITLRLVASRSGSSCRFVGSIAGTRR